MTNHTPGLPDHTIASLLADTEPYLSCDDCFVRLDEYTERRTADPNYDDPAMRAHLRGCGACADEANALLDLLTRDAD
jgi:hypothetical protein